MADCQSTLRGHENDPVPDDILQLREAAKKDFQTKDAKKKDQTWLTKSDEKKHAEPERYLKETFRNGEKGKETVQFRAHGTIWMHGIANKLGLEYLTTREPPRSMAMFNIPYDVAGCRTG